MLKTLRVPAELIALSQMQRATSREVGAPLYLPAFEDRMLGVDPASNDANSRSVSSFEIVTIGDDEDDDFY